MQIGIFKTADEVADVAIKELIDVLSVADVKTLEMCIRDRSDTRAPKWGVIFDWRNKMGR